MERLKFRGREYSIFIIFDKIKGIFSIRALHNKTKRYSSINNLNCILSHLNINADNPKFFDGSWELSKNEVNSLVKKTIDLLRDKKFLKYLENQLNLDRSLGEWENSEPLKKEAKANGFKIKINNEFIN